MALTGVDFSDNYRRAAGAAQAGAVEPKILGAQEDTNIFKESEQKPAESVDVKPQDPVNPSSHVNGTTAHPNNNPWSSPSLFGDLTIGSSSNNNSGSSSNVDTTGVSLWTDTGSINPTSTEDDALFRIPEPATDTQVAEEEEQKLQRETAHLFSTYV